MELAEMPAAGISSPATLPRNTTGLPATGAETCSRTRARTPNQAASPAARALVREPAKNESTVRLGPGASRTAKLPSAAVTAVLARS
jgi:hypothetical protein